MVNIDQTLKVLVIVPAHNEAQAIAGVVDGVRARGLDVLVIDDGSADDTGRIARERGAVVLRNDIKQGKGFSLQRGFEYALRQNYAGVITLDGDGQHDPRDLANFLNQISKNPEGIVAGNRMNDTRGMPMVRRATNMFMSWLVSGICRQSVPDTQCGYRYIGRTVLSGLEITSRDFEIETEVLVQASRMGFRIDSVPVQTIYRTERSKINPIKDTFRFIIYLSKVKRSKDCRRPDQTKL